MSIIVGIVSGLVTAAIIVAVVFRKSKRIEIDVVVKRDDESS